MLQAFGDSSARFSKAEQCTKVRDEACESSKLALQLRCFEESPAKLELKNQQEPEQVVNIQSHLPLLASCISICVIIHRLRALGLKDVGLIPLHITHSLYDFSTTYLTARSLYSFVCKWGSEWLYHRSPRG